MLNSKDKGVLLQIIKRCKRIEDKITYIELSDFSNNDDLKEIISFNIFQIGELSSKLSKEFVEKYNKVPWNLIKGMRNRIVHGYDSIDIEIVWNTALDSISELKEYCIFILENNKENIY